MVKADEKRDAWTGSGKFSDTVSGMLSVRERLREMVGRARKRG